MKIEDLTFPVTLEAFIAFQEAGTGRELEPMEREVIAAWLPLFNLEYADGVREDSTALANDLVKMDELIAMHGEDAPITRILKFVRRWLTYAWKRGNAMAQHGEGSTCRGR